MTDLNQRMQFLGDENIQKVEDFLGDRLKERIVDSSQDCLLTHITFLSPDGLVTVPIGTTICRNLTGTYSPYIPFSSLKLGVKGKIHVVMSDH